MEEKQPGQGDVGKERKPEWPETGKQGGDGGKKGGGMGEEKPEEKPKERPTV
jgi:hypothetical protein